METFGVHKRDILVDRVEEGREAQADAKQEFVSALDAFKQVVDFQGGDLEELYDELKDRHASSADAVEEVESKVRAIEQVAQDLFSEWKSEIGQIQDDDLRRGSEDLLRDTQTRYGKLIKAMKNAEAKMEPVLTAFNDRVLFLKHNLNAKAIASLQDQVTKMETNVGALVADMEKSIAEADAFIAAMDDSAAK
jgi:hypothetical protein